MTTEKDRPCVYMIKNTITGKVYIGSSIKGRRRLTQHKLGLNRNEHFNSYLQRSWNKNGSEAFEFSVLELCDDNVRLEREQFWIDKFNSSNPEFGYNISHSVRTLAPAELRSKISKDYWDNLSDEERLHQSSIRKALWDDPDWRSEREADLLRKGRILLAKRQSDPEFHERCLSGLARQRSDPEAQEKRAAKIRETWNRPEVKAKQSARKKALAADPDYMLKHNERAASEASKAKLRAHNKKQWEDPAIKAKRLEGLKKGRESFWADPVKRAERLALLSRKRTEAAEKRRNKNQLSMI